MKKRNEDKKATSGRARPPVTRRNPSEAIQPRIKLDTEISPWMFGHFSEAAATLKCSIIETVLAFLNSDPVGDALCDWINDLREPETTITQEAREWINNLRQPKSPTTKEAR